MPSVLQEAKGRAKTRINKLLSSIPSEYTESKLKRTDEFNIGHFYGLPKIHNSPKNWSYARLYP